MTERCTSDGVNSWGGARAAQAGQHVEFAGTQTMSAEDGVGARGLGSVDAMQGNHQRHQRAIIGGWPVFAMHCYRIGKVIGHTIVSA